MAAFLLAVHVVAAIVFVGSVTVAVSLFPRYARLALDGTTAAQAVPGLQLLHRVARVYAVLALSVPVFGFAVAVSLDVLGQSWVLVSIGLTLLAGAMLGGSVLPRQRDLLAAATARPADEGATAAGPGPDAAAQVRRLAMLSGVFNLVWVVVVVLMIVRPGSTTGV